MTPDEIVDPNRGVRRILYFLGGSCALLGFLFPMQTEGYWIYFSLFAIAGMMVVVMAAISFPYVVLRHEGVMVRFLFRKRQYRWSEIMGAGRYWRNKKAPAKENFSLVLVCPLGNGKKIQLPNEREIRLFIVAHYGPLNYDNYKGISSYEKKVYKLDET